MNRMNYAEVLLSAKSHQEIEDLLKGYDMTIFEPSQYAGGDPIDAEEALSKAVYPAYRKNSHIKEEMEQVLTEMLGKTDYDVYIVTLYIMCELFNEKNNISPFTMDLSKILAILKKELLSRQSRIQDGIHYPNGYLRAYAWEQLIRYNKVCQEEYGITLF